MLYTSEYEPETDSMHLGMADPQPGGQRMSSGNLIGSFASGPGSLRHLGTRPFVHSCPRVTID